MTIQWTLFENQLIFSVCPNYKVATTHPTTTEKYFFFPEIMKIIRRSTRIIQTESFFIREQDSASPSWPMDSFFVPRDLFFPAKNVLASSCHVDSVDLRFNFFLFGFRERLRYVLGDFRNRPLFARLDRVRPTTRLFRAVSCWILQLIRNHPPFQDVLSAKFLSSSGLHGQASK